MTVAELIIALQELPKEAEVWVYSDGWEDGCSAPLNEIEVQGAGLMVMLTGDARS